MERAGLFVHPPDDPHSAASDVSDAPGLIQWLELADQKQYRPLVEACLAKLIPEPSETNQPGLYLSVCESLISRNLMRKVLTSDLLGVDDEFNHER